MINELIEKYKQLVEENYDEDNCAGWLIIGDDQEIINAFYGCADKIFNLKEDI